MFSTANKRYRLYNNRSYIYIKKTIIKLIEINEKYWRIVIKNFIDIAVISYTRTPTQWVYQNVNLKIIIY